MILGPRMIIDCHWKYRPALFSSRKLLFQTGKNYIKMMLLGRHNITFSEITHLTIDSTEPPAYIARVENIITFTELGWRSSVDRVLKLCTDIMLISRLHNWVSFRCSVPWINNVFPLLFIYGSPLCYNRQLIVAPMQPYGDVQLEEH